MVMMSSIIAQALGIALSLAARYFSRVYLLAVPPSLLALQTSIQTFERVKTCKEFRMICAVSSGICLGYFLVCCMGILLILNNLMDVPAVNASTTGMPELACLIAIWNTVMGTAAHILKAENSKESQGSPNKNRSQE